MKTHCERCGGYLNTGGKCLELSCIGRAQTPFSGQPVLYQPDELTALRARIAELEAERDRLKKILAESCDDNRQEYFASYDCAMPCPIGFKVNDLEAENTALRARVAESESLLNEYKDAEHRALKSQGEALAERGRLRALLRRWYKTRGLHNEGSLLDDTESALEGE